MTPTTTALPTNALNFNWDGLCALADATRAADSDSEVGDCSAGNGPQTCDLRRAAEFTGDCAGQITQQVVQVAPTAAPSATQSYSRSVRGFMPAGGERHEHEVRFLSPPGDVTIRLSATSGNLKPGLTVFGADGNELSSGYADLPAILERELDG